MGRVRQAMTAIQPVGGIKAGPGFQTQAGKALGHSKVDPVAQDDVGDACAARIECREH